MTHGHDCCQQWHRGETVKLADLIAAHPATTGAEATTRAVDANTVAQPQPGTCPVLATEDVAALSAIAAPFTTPGPYLTERTQLASMVRVRSWPSPAVAASAWVPRRFWPNQAPVLYLHRGLMGAEPAVIDAVVAHEVGHLVHQHRPGLLATTLTWWGPLVVTALLIAGLATPGLRSATLAFVATMTLAGSVLTLREARRARSQELEADDLAAALGRTAALTQYLHSRMRPHPYDTSPATAWATLVSARRRVRHQWATHPHPRDRIDRLRLSA